MKKDAVRYCTSGVLVPAGPASAAAARRSSSPPLYGLSNPIWPCNEPQQYYESQQDSSCCSVTFQ